MHSQQSWFWTHTTLPALPSCLYYPRSHLRDPRPSTRQSNSLPLRQRRRNPPPKLALLITPLLPPKTSVRRRAMSLGPAKVLQVQPARSSDYAAEFVD